MEHDHPKPKTFQTPRMNEATEQGLDGVAQRRHPTMGGGPLSGAPLSNTAPANYIPPDNPLPEVLRFGVDSLYLSYRGELSTEWAQRLQGLKDAARSEDESDQSRAQVKIGEHLLEVKPKGRGMFTYVLVDNCYQIALAGNSSQSLPLAYVQVSSELLTAIGSLQAEQKLTYIIKTLGRNVEGPSISRADLFADFMLDADISSWPPSSWITRAHRLDMHHTRRQFSGWSIGMGGNIGARLYDKTLELEKSKKEYLKPLWEAAGWDSAQKVWRLEFQFKRDVLRELEVIGTADLLDTLRGLWRYASESWLRLTIPAPDTNQTRWPTHPIWEALSAIDWGDPDAPSLVRVKTDRPPSDQTLFVNGLGPITSFMAREGITDLGEGFGEFLAHAHHYHDQLGRQKGQTFNQYIQSKVAIKGKKFSSIKNHNPEDADRIAAQQEAYRKQRDGE